MGYRIDYRPIRKIRRLEIRHSPRWAMTGVFALLFLFLTFSFWPEGADLLRRLLIPGDLAVTVAALEELSTDLREGAQLTEALEVFCRNVLTESNGY